MWVRKVGWGPGAAVEGRRTQPEAWEGIPAWPLEFPGMSFGMDAQGLAGTRVVLQLPGLGEPRVGCPGGHRLSWRPQPVTGQEGHKGPSSSHNTQTALVSLSGWQTSKVCPSLRTDTCHHVDTA